MRCFLAIFLILPVFCLSQRQKNVDFKTAGVTINRIKKGHLSGSVLYNFEIKNDTDSIFLDARNMVFNTVLLNRKPFHHKYLNQKLYVYHAFKKNEKYQLIIKYAAFPEQTVYFIEREKTFSLKKRDTNNIGQAWTQGQGKYTSNWLPSLDDMNDKIEFDLSVRCAPQFTVVANGQLKSYDSTGNFYKYWRFDMSKPMSSYLVAFVIGDFDKKVIKTTSGIPIELYYEPKDSLQVEPTYRYTKEIFNFLEEEIGVAYPWQNYKQVPVQDFLYAGMENTTCTIFSNQYVIDSTAFVDKNYVNVNAHEMAHQWFGNLVTEQSGEHHWLHEGFATYYAYLSEKELFGEDYFYWKLSKTAKTLHNLSENEGGEALTDPNANSLTFYEKGAWALVMLKELVGDKVFRKGIKNYLDTYAFKNATISDFLREMEKASQLDLTLYREKWLVSEEFPWEEVKSFLRAKNTSLKLFFELQEKHADTTIVDGKNPMHLWNDEMPVPFKREFLFNYASKIPDSGLMNIIQSEPIEVRQAVALALPEISEELQTPFESMLRDKSYVTQEVVLFKLWQTFPEKRHHYLDVLDGVVGLPNKNVRQLWLTLAMITQDYRPERKKAFYEELNAYTSAENNFEVRQLAFQYLYQIGALSDGSLKNLFGACHHHVWQFKKSSRNLIREINASAEGQRRLQDFTNTLSSEEKQEMDTILNP